MVSVSDLRAVDVAVRLELPADVGVVVDLAVEDHPDAAVLVRQRLLAGAEIDDAQAAMGERGVRVAVQPGFVGAAMGDDVAHPQRARRRVLDRVRRPPRFRQCRTCQETASWEWPAGTAPCRASSVR